MNALIQEKTVQIIINTVRCSLPHPTQRPSNPSIPPLKLGWMINQFESRYILLAKQQLWIGAFLNFLFEGVDNEPSEKVLRTVSIIGHLRMRPSKGSHTTSRRSSHSN